MAIITLTLDVDNLVPVNGQYVFTSQFVDTITGQLINDPKFPQNQIHTATNITDPYDLPITIADGNYQITNTKVRVLYKDKVIERVISPSTVSCTEACTVFPVISVTRTNATTYNITLSAAGTNTFSWKIFNSLGIQQASGTANVTANSFNITTPNLTTGNYFLELNGSTCRGQTTFPFSVTSSLPPCDRGPILLNILTSSATSLKFQFDGNGVFGIGWKIKQGTSVLRDGVIKHVSIAQPGDATFSDASPTINYAALPSGNYTLEIEGNTCTTTGVSPAKSFTVGSTPDPLAFISGSPSVSGSSGNYSMSIAINKDGAYNTTILNSTTGTYYQNGNVTYVAGTPFVKTGLPVGTYIVKVGTLETTLIISNTGGSPCDNGPFLQNVISASPAGLSFLFDGNNVTAITWRIKQGTNVLRTGVVYPTNNHPFITYNELPLGDYTLEIEGNNCVGPPGGPSVASFSIVEVPQGNNAGVIVTNVGNKSIGIINARYFKATANPTTGNIRLFYDELSTADGDGNKQVKGWLMGSQLQEIKAADVAALRSTNGMALPDGNHDFYLYYFPTSSVQTFSQIKANIGLISGPQWVQNSKVAERVTVEIKTNATL